MRFFSEFALLARDLHDAVGLYSGECSRPCQADHVLDPARLRPHLEKAEAQIEALTCQARVPNDRIRDYLDRMQRLGIPVVLPHPAAAAEPDTGLDAAPKLDLDRFLAADETVGGGGRGGRMTTPARPARPRLSSSSSLSLKSPEMPIISSHSQAIMSLRYQTDNHRAIVNNNLRASPTPVMESEFEQVPGFVRSRVTLDEVNDVLSRVSIGDQITSDHLETELGFGSKAKAVIMVLQQLDRIQSSCRQDGEVLYAITSGPASS